MSRRRCSWCGCQGSTCEGRKSKILQSPTGMAKGFRAWTTSFFLGVGLASFSMLAVFILCLLPTSTPKSSQPFKIFLRGQASLNCAVEQEEDLFCFFFYIGLLQGQDTFLRPPWVWQEELLRDLSEKLNLKGGATWSTHSCLPPGGSPPVPTLEKLGKNYIHI